MEGKAEPVALEPACIRVVAINESGLGKMVAAYAPHRQFCPPAPHNPREGADAEA